MGDLAGGVDEPGQACAPSSRPGLRPSRRRLRRGVAGDSGWSGTWPSGEALEGWVLLVGGCMLTLLVAACTDRCLHARAGIGGAQGALGRSSRACPPCTTNNASWRSHEGEPAVKACHAPAARSPVGRHAGPRRGLGRPACCAWGSNSTTQGQSSRGPSLSWALVEPRGWGTAPATPVLCTTTVGQTAPQQRHRRASGRPDGLLATSRADLCPGSPKGRPGARARPR